MTDLSRIDFSRCELPMWKNSALRVERVIEGIHIDMSDLLGTVHVAAKVLPGVHHPNENQWIAQLPGTFAELDELKAICAKVDAFIESELKRMAEEKLPPWRECALEEAQEYQFLQQDGSWSRFFPMENHGGSVIVKYRYRTRVLKPEPKKEPVRDSGVHCPRCGSTKMKSGTVNTDSGIEIAPCAPWVTSNGVTAVQPKPIVTTAKCQCTCGSSFESREEHWPEKKPEPKLPNVKPPDGTRWQRWGGGKGLAISGDGIWCNLPDSKLERDAMLACVAAYDEANGTPPCVIMPGGGLSMLVEVSK